MGLEWHNRKRSFDGRFAKRAEGLRNEAGIEIDQLHVRLKATTAEEIRTIARNMKMEISELVEVALEKCIEEVYAIADAMTDAGGEQTEEPTTSGGLSDGEQRQTTE